MMRVCKVFAKPNSVKQQLEAMGLLLEYFQTAIQQGYSSRVTRTQNDSPTAPGFYQWNETVRFLRDQLVTEGWKRRNISNIPLITHPKNIMSIDVCSGNKFTGVEDKAPSTRNSKGQATASLIEYNQYSLDLKELNTSDTERNKENIWILLFYLDQEKQELRSELSLPSKYSLIGSEDRKVTDWIMRLILPTLPLNPVPAEPLPNFGPDIDFTIAKKAG
ncbi:hypothetical protein [Entomobacter blattae]|uniref:Uncharacterized protein n=1 Tax=Entomobacter blattae TaxID=2762277 RepID=A0A7H1NUD3_9PROT|nr:hypothetical protein [Entomobacter blattae]QNT79393.1 hypothetical protein JGUZn3_21920 [Entomobacter blattae]